MDVTIVKVEKHAICYVRNDEETVLRNWISSTRNEGFIVVARIKERIGLTLTEKKDGSRDCTEETFKGVVVTKAIWKEKIHAT